MLSAGEGYCYDSHYMERGKREWDNEHMESRHYQVVKTLNAKD